MNLLTIFVLIISIVSGHRNRGRLSKYVHGCVMILQGRCVRPCQRFIWKGVRPCTPSEKRQHIERLLARIKH